MGSLSPLQLVEASEKKSRSVTTYIVKETLIFTDAYSSGYNRNQENRLSINRKITSNHEPTDAVSEIKCFGYGYALYLPEADGQSKIFGSGSRW
jgi:hypothetical protein